MIIVRMPVARFELIFATPNLAKIAVREAKSRCNNEKLLGALILLPVAGSVASASIPSNVR